MGITELGESCAEGTADKVAEVEAALKSGELQVFDTSKFTVNGEHPTSILVDMDGDFEGETEGVVDGVFMRVLPALRSRLHRPDRRHHRAEQLRPALRYPQGKIARLKRIHFQKGKPLAASLSWFFACAPPPAEKTRPTGKKPASQALRCRI